MRKKDKEKYEKFAGELEEVSSEVRFVEVKHFFKNPYNKKDKKEYYFSEIELREVFLKYNKEFKYADVIAYVDEPIKIWCNVEKELNLYKKYIKAAKKRKIIVLEKRKRKADKIYEIDKYLRQYTYEDSNCLPGELEQENLEDNAEGIKLKNE